jgi:5-methylcytosine-specific restriction endonuclease McrA
MPFYAKARRLTRETGVEHQVDHIQPLSAGGSHHPSNLQVLTRAENRRKGNTWPYPIAAQTSEAV